MSDRSYVVLRYRKCDEELIFAAAPDIENHGDEHNEDDDDVVEVHFDAVRGGGYQWSDAFHKAGLTFLMHYDACYGACPAGICGAFFDEVFDVATKDNHQFVVEMDEDTLQPDPENLEKVKTAIIIEKKIMAYFDGNLTDIKPEVAKAILFNKSKFKIDEKDAN